jgi:hypothetical protein
MRIVVGGRAKNQTAALTSEMARFETETLSTKENLKHLILHFPDDPRRSACDLRQNPGNPSVSNDFLPL